MTQLAIDVAGPEPDPALSQWLTPPALARELVGLAAPLLNDARRRGFPLRVIEPSAGRGNLVRAVLERCPGALVDAVEIDPRWQADLESLPINVSICDYLARPAPPALYHLSVSNVPFDDGDEVDHIAKLLDECERALALLPARSLHGRGRYERVWRRFDPRNASRDWWIRQKKHSIARPNFGRTGGSDEIVLLDLRRAPGGCEVSWL